MNDAQLLTEASTIRQVHPYDIVKDAIKRLDSDIQDVINCHDVYSMIRETNLLPRYVRYYAIDIVAEHHNTL